MTTSIRSTGWLALAAVCLAAPAADGRVAEARHQLYKCVDAAAVTSIQSSPCPAGSTTVWKRDAPPEVSTPEGNAQAEARRQRDQQTVRELSQQVERIQKAAEASAAPPDASPAPAASAAPTAPTGDAAVAAAAAAPTPNPDLQACRDAQAFADAVREKEWLGLSDDQVRRLFGWVAIQCKVPTSG